MSTRRMRPPAPKRQRCPLAAPSTRNAFAPAIAFHYQGAPPARIRPRRSGRGAASRPSKRKEARERFAEVLQLAHDCGAAGLEELARTELAATGARPRKAVFTGVESLTPSELRVARIAAEGMTNREIAQALTVTEKTVETHLRGSIEMSAWI
jgi:DNA-binding CsgD family transcriptional regulator